MLAAALLAVVHLLDPFFHFLARVCRCSRIKAAVAPVFIASSSSAMNSRIFRVFCSCKLCGSAPSPLPHLDFVVDALSVVARGLCGFFRHLDRIFFYFFATVDL